MTEHRPFAPRQRSVHRRSPRYDVVGNLGIGVLVAGGGLLQRLRDGLGFDFLGEERVLAAAIRSTVSVDVARR